jgi:hypothetical protein
VICLMFFTAAMRRRISRWLAIQRPRPAICGWLTGFGPITLDLSLVRARSRTSARRTCAGLSVLDAHFMSGANIA